MTLTWLATDLRDAGLDVREVDGWQTRARPGSFAPIGVLIHDTGTPARTGDAPSLNTCITGRSDLAGPLCQLLIGRSGSVWVIAGGKTNNAGDGILPGLRPNTGNNVLVGIELENTGNGTEPWPAHQVAVAQRCAAVILRRLWPVNTTPALNVWGHREYARPVGRKDDPVGIDMTQFRAAVRTLLTQPQETDDMPGLHQLGAAMLTLNELYQLHRGTPPALAERTDWARDFERKLAAGIDLTDTYRWIAQALDAEKKPAKA